MSSLKFGTSGLRGLVTDLEGWPSFAHAKAFLLSLDAGASGDRVVLIGRDLRPSSPAIAATVADAAASAGYTALDCGALPTPALALEAMRRGAPAVMVTGSHIPQDRNGLKFYRPDGEITKADEAAILAALAGVGETGTVPTPPVRAEDDTEALARYRSRFMQFFAPGSLDGLTVAVYQQSSVARDLLGELLAALGANVVPLGRSDTFVPIDTEAHRPEDVAFFRKAAEEGDYDALVTTDGDADRPLMADRKGRILRGDVVGTIAARHLGADAVVVPVTAGSALERTGGFATVRRTKVGSPHVIAGMEAAAREGGRVVVGFEANGGFLLGSPVRLGDRTISALPTRDAMLPMLAVLAAAKAAGTSLGKLVDAMDAGETASDRLADTPSEKSAALLARLGEDDFRDAFLRPVGRCEGVDTTDGLRLALDGHRTIHFRASGNAPELRCYAEAGSAAEAEELVRWGLGVAADAMR